MGVHSHTVAGVLDPSVVWERWTDVEHWPVDDPDIAMARLNGPLAKGALGWVQRRPKGRRTTFRIAQVDRLALRFTIEMKLLLATLTAEHMLDKSTDEDDAPEPPPGVDADAWLLTNRVTIRGPLAGVWDRVLGRRIADRLERVSRNVLAAASV